MSIKDYTNHCCNSDGSMSTPKNTAAQINAEPPHPKNLLMPGYPDRMIKHESVRGGNTAMFRYRVNNSLSRLKE